MAWFFLSVSWGCGGFQLILPLVGCGSAGEAAGPAVNNFLVRFFRGGLLYSVLKVYSVI